MYSHEVRVATKFPTVTIEEASNTQLTSAITADRKDHYVNLVYNVNVYSNLPEIDGKEQVKEIMEVIDDWMLEHGLTRHLNTFMQNYQTSISRRFAKYSCIYSDEGIVFKPL